MDLMELFKEIEEKDKKESMEREMTFWAQYERARKDMERQRRERELFIEAQQAETLLIQRSGEI